MRRQLTPEEARGQAADLADAPIVPIALPGCCQSPLDWRWNSEHPIYDCFYLSAAMQKDTHVVTRIGSFSRKLLASLPSADRVKLLGG